MATTTFVVRKSKKNREGKIPIYLQYCHKSRTALISTGERVLPESWNAQEGKLRKSRRYPELDTIQDILSQKKAILERLVREAKLKQIEPSVEYIKAQFKGLNEQGESKAKEERSFFEIIDTCIKSARHTRSKATQGIYVTTKRHLENFETKTRKKLTFAGMSREFYDKFCEYIFEDLGFSTNTAGKYIKTLKVFLNYAADQGMIINPAYRKFKVFKEEPDVIYLTQKELDLLAEADLQDDQRLAHCRDVFLFACYTGLRFSDVSQLKPEHIRDNSIHFQTQKTQDRLRIPLISQAKTILDRYKGQFLNALPVISIQKMNNYLKELAEKVGIDTPIETTRSMGNEKLITTQPKHQLISTHTARRTFITLSLEKGMRPEVLMQITGHKNFKTLMRYVKILDKVKEDELLKAWET
ncbi:MAG: site-specific integrase [Bacteroidota bacterium]